MGGDVSLVGNQDAGQTLRFSGQNLAILAQGNVLGSGPLNLIDLSNRSGNGGNLLIMAGYDFTNPSPGVYAISGPSSSGGSVNLPGVTLHTSAPGHSGTVTILAPENAAATNGGAIDVGTIDTTSAGGVGGDVLVIGQSSLRFRGEIRTTGDIPGQVNIAGGIPILPATAQVVNSALNVEPSGDPVPDLHAPINIIFDNAINTLGGPHGDVNVLSNGNIGFAPAASVSSGGQILIGTTDGVILLSSGVNLLATNDVVLLAGAPGISLQGNNGLLANFGSVVLLSEGDVDVGAGSALLANDAVLLGSDSGRVHVGGGSTLIGLSALGLLGGNGVDVDSGSTIISGQLETTANQSGPLQFNDIDHAGFMLIAAENVININSSLIVNGGDIAVLADGGNLNLGNGTSFIANGGYITMFSTGKLLGGNNTFLSRAVGSPEFFFGGLIQLSSGFSFNPDIIALYQGEAGAKTAVGSLHHKILAAADDLQSYLHSGNQLFLVPETDDNGIILDSSIIGSAIQILDQSFGPAVLRPIKIGSGQVDVSNSTIALLRGAIFFESVGSGSQVSLPNSTFVTESYGILPTGLFDRIVQVVGGAITSDHPTELRFLDDTTIIPTDQNRVHIHRDVGEIERLAQPAHVLSHLRGKSDEGKAEKEQKRLIAGELEGPIVDTAEAGADGQAQVNNHDSRSQIQVERSRLQLVGTDILPIIRVSEKYSNLMMFTSANQVLTGNFGNSNDAVAVGANGTAISANRDVVVLHCGKIMADSGKSPMVITTKMGTVRIPADTTAIVTSTPGQPLRVMSVGGEAVTPIEVQSRGMGKDETPLKVAPGEELVVAENSLSDEDLIPVDGLDRAIISGGITKSGSGKSASRSMKNKISLKQVIDREPLIAGKSIRLGGGRRGAGFNRAAQRIAHAAKQQDPNVNLSKFFATTAAGKDPGEPVKVLAEDGTMFREIKEGEFELKSGTLFVDSPANTVIKTKLGAVQAGKDSRISLEYEKGKLRVQSCSGPGKVSVKCGDDVIALAPGKEVLITEKAIAKDEAIEDDGIGRRQLSAYQMKNKNYAIVGDFAIVSLLNSARHLRSLREPITETDSQMRHKIEKVAAVVEYTSSSRGRYMVRQKETASRI
jgi:hypothetical protein